VTMDWQRPVAIKGWDFKPVLTALATY